MGSGDPARQPLRRTGALRSGEHSAGPSDYEEWADTIGVESKPLDASSDNISWDGETMNFFGRTIPVLKVKKWLTDDELKALESETAAANEWPDVIGTEGGHHGSL